MKKIFLFLSAALVLSSCSEQDSKDVSRVTYYPNFTLIGDAVMFVHKGDTFTDPGVTVTEGDTELDYTTSVTGLYRGGTSIDTNVDDIYTITYSATNQDGFSGSITRKVIVADTGDLSTSISGLYRATVTRNGTLTAQYTDMEYVLIWQTGANTYHVSDGIGGYYAIGRGYGIGYAAPMDVVANNIQTNDFTVPDFTVGSFGGVVQNTEFTVNAEGGTIHFTSDWDQGYTFSVLLEQVQF